MTVSAISANTYKAATDGRVNPMIVSEYSDWSSSIGGSFSTMFTLNYNLRKRAAGIHEGLAARLGIATTDPHHLREGQS